MKTAIAIKKGYTTAIVANTTATKAQTLSEEDKLAQKWLSIGSENADTIATNANTGAKTANLSITNMLKVAWAKLNAVMLANPALAIAAGAALLATAIIGVTVWFEKAGERAKEAADKSREALKDTLSEIENINSKLETTKKRIDELTAKKHPSLVEADELHKLKKFNNELERELRIKEALAKQQQKEANDDAVKYFNTKTNSVQYSTEGGRMHVSDSRNYSIIDDTENKINQLPEMKARLNEYLRQLSALEKGDNFRSNPDWLNLQGRINQLNTEIKNYEETVNSNIKKFMETDDSLVEGMDNGILEQLNRIYNAYDELNNGVAYKHTDTISGILEKADFSSNKDLLMEMGKEGNLSIKTLTANFPKLIAYLKEAGISAQELYQYIMSLANPDAMDYNAARNQLMKSLFGNGGVNSKSDAQDWQKIVNSGITSDTGLEAYLKVKSEFSDGQTKYWTVDDWINAVNNKMKEDLTGTDTIHISNIFSLKDTENNDTVLSNLKNQLSDIENAYQTCLAAKEEYNEQGYLSVNTLQNVLSLGDEYLKYLFDEEGNVHLDADAFQQLAQAKINSMEAQALKNLAENIQQITDETTATKYLAQEQNTLASSYADVAANALIAMSSIDGFSNSMPLQNAYNHFKSQYEQIKSLFANTRNELSTAYKDNPTSSDPLKDAFTKEYTALKHNLEMEYITEKQYYDSLDALNQKYFAGKSEYLDDCRKYEEEIYKGLQKYYKEYADSNMNLLGAQLDACVINYKHYSSAVKSLLDSLYSDGKLSAQDYFSYTQQMLEKQKGRLIVGEAGINILRGSLRLRILVEIGNTASGTGQHRCSHHHCI